MLQTRLTLTLLVLAAGTASAQWDPENGEWRKSDDTDLRVMSWNVEDAICSSTDRKTNAFNDWNAIARIIAALRPDVLILQETADNSGNGTGGGVDSIFELETTIDLLFNGGNDPFNGNSAVSSFVQNYAPGYTLPFVAVSNTSDGFNRNVILSRYPIADINGDGIAELSNFVVIPDAFQTGGNGGIRGFGIAEIDLPDEIYAGDVVVGNSHLKAGGDSSDRADRLEAAQNIAYLIDYFYNGNGGPVADPNNKIPLPSGMTPLDENTPVIWGGDWNEDESSNGRRGPASWMVEAENFGGSDGTDRDRSDSTFDNAVQPVTNDDSTQGNSKLDYIAWQDSIATARREFVFRSSGTGMTVDRLPIELRSFPVSPIAASNIAADHRPVVVDFILPLADTKDPCIADWNSDGKTDFFDVSLFLAQFSAQDPATDLTDDGMFDFFDVSQFLAAFSAGCP